MTRYFHALVAAVALATAVLFPSHTDAQPTRRPPMRVLDSTAVVCMDITWLDAGSICEGRLGNAVSSAVLSGIAGGLAGAAGGAIAPTACLGGAESAAVRGLAVGAGMGLVTGLLVRQVSRRQLAARNATERAAKREAERRDPTKPWSWRDVRPAFVLTGSMALGGTAIGAIRGATSACEGGVGVNALRGAGVYGGGMLASIGVSLVAVRWLF
jgi:hypothetical protein